jgi:hypothetical protein
MGSNNNESDDGKANQAGATKTKAERQEMQYDSVD